MLEAHPYNISVLYDNYYSLAAGNVAKVLGYQLSDTTDKANSHFNMTYTHYNISLPTSRLSVLDIVTDVRQAIDTDDPSFMVRNE